MNNWGRITLVLAVVFGVCLLSARIWLDRRRGSARPRAWLEAALGILAALILFALLISRPSA